MLATTKQRDWVRFLLLEREWLHRFVEADTNIRRLVEISDVGTYDEVTKGMMNYLRNVFSGDEVILQKWEEYNEGVWELN